MRHFFVRHFCVGTASLLGLVAALAVPAQSDFTPTTGLIRGTVAMFPNHADARAYIVDDPDLSDSLSLQSLWLASTLIVRARPGNLISTVIRGPIQYEYRAVRVTSILKSLAGPDETVKPNDMLVVLDRTPVIGREFLDDLELRPTDDAILFLERLPRLQLVAGHAMIVHKFTAPNISKFEVMNGALQPMSVRATRVSDQMRGVRSMGDFYQRVAKTAARTELDANSALLGKLFAGYSANSLRHSLLTEPWKVEQRFARQDAVLPRRM